VYKLKFSNYIYEDIKSSVNYIKYDLQNPVAAQRLKNEIKKTYGKIKENPFIYPAVPAKSLALKGYRFTMIKNYMLFYKVKENQINFDRFLYGPRDWINILNETNMIED
jgi:plasmid stabilization system protein ParE